MIGYVFYDRLYGDIKGVSMRCLEELSEKFPWIEVPGEQAEALLTGALQVSDWTVGHSPDRKTLTMIPLSSFRVDLSWVHGDWELLTSDNESSPVTITVNLGRTGKYAEVRLDTTAPNMVVQSSQTDRLRFVVTRRGDPDAILASWRINLDELSRRRAVTVALANPLPEDIEVRTIRMWPVSYRLNRVERVRPRLPMPKGPFESLRRVPSAPEAPVVPSLLLTMQGGRLDVRLHDGGGPFYDRGLNHLMVALCRPNNPDALIERHHIPVERLEHGETVSVEVSPSGDFDVYAELMYCDAFFVRAP